MAAPKDRTGYSSPPRLRRPQPWKRTPCKPDWWTWCSSARGSSTSVVCLNVGACFGAAGGLGRRRRYLTASAAIGVYVCTRGNGPPKAQTTKLTRCFLTPNHSPNSAVPMPLRRSSPAPEFASFGRA